MDSIDKPKKAVLTLNSITKKYFILLQESVKT